MILLIFSTAFSTPGGRRTEMSYPAGLYGPTRYPSAPASIPAVCLGHSHLDKPRFPWDVLGVHFRRSGALFKLNNYILTN